MNYFFSARSNNAKTGPIPVTTSSSGTCPATCSVAAECYAKTGPISWFWSKLDRGEIGHDYDTMIEQIRSIPQNTLWRHNQAGDLAHRDGRIDHGKLHKLVDANIGKRGFAYTHHAPTKHNLTAIRYANAHGLTINLSADNPQHAATLQKKHKGRIPVVCILPVDAPVRQLIGGIPIVVCPAQRRDDITCKSCGVCQNRYREYVIGFRAHGARKNKLTEKIKMVEG
jgi:hypothetical protein